MPFVEELSCQPSFGVSVEASHVYSAVVAFKLERTCNRGWCLRPKPLYFPVSMQKKIRSRSENFFMQSDITNRFRLVG